MWSDVWWRSGAIIVQSVYDQPNCTFMRSRMHLSDHKAICKAIYLWELSAHFGEFSRIYVFSLFAHGQAQSDHTPSRIWPLGIATGSARYWSQSKLIVPVCLISFAFVYYYWTRCDRWLHLVAAAVIVWVWSSP